MKTIKQIADELGVSKQKVYRFIVRNHITASSEVKQSKLYDEATEMLIKQGILEDEPYQKSHHEAHQNHINDTVSEAVIVGVALKMNNNAIAIIGGVDGPTSVFVAGKLNSVLVSILLIAIGVVMLIVAIIFYLKRKR